MSKKKACTVRACFEFPKWNSKKLKKAQKSSKKLKNELKHTKKGSKERWIVENISYINALGIQVLDLLILRAITHFCLTDL
ncbi:TPA: hypothetical protein VQR90_001347 [Streptococcus pneumoniae]|nr:hypothetical protein [Streptococcus pneumoniae]